MGKTYRCRLEVRGYELDSFGHVNHAVYVSYCEHARWEMLKSEGVTLETLSQWQRWPVIANLEFQYLKPTFIGDALEIQTHLVERGKTHFTFEHVLRRGDQEVVKAKVRAVMVNEKGRPSELPPALAALWDTQVEGSAL